MNSQSSAHSNDSSGLQFESQIQQWVAIDNQIKQYYEKIEPIHDKIAELKEKQNEITEKINQYVSKNQLTNAAIQISDGKLKFTNKSVPSSLSFKYLEKSLGEIIKNETQVKQIVDYLRENREVKVVSEIKRTYDH